MLPPQYSTNFFSDVCPRKSGVYVTVRPHGNTQRIYLAGLQCVLSEYCARATKELTRIVSVVQSLPSIRRPTSVSRQSTLHLSLTFCLQEEIDEIQQIVHFYWLQSWSRRINLLTYGHSGSLRIRAKFHPEQVLWCIDDCCMILMARSIQHISQGQMINCWCLRAISSAGVGANRPCIPFPTPP